MDTLNLHEEPTTLDNFIHRNTRTEISNFEGSFRPGLFSRIDSSSSFESSFDNSGDNFIDVITEERPLSKSYKPDSVLKASFLTERPSSPSFKGYETRNEKLKLETSSRLAQNEDFSKNVVKLSERKHSSQVECEKEDKFLTLIDIISQKDEEIKSLRSQVFEKEKEISELCSKSKVLQTKLQKTSEETIFLQTSFDSLTEKYQKSELTIRGLQQNISDLQKDLAINKEDRLRRLSEEKKPEIKAKDLLAEIDCLKVELQKRPTVGQYQSAIARIEELEGMLSQRKSPNSEPSIKCLLDTLKLSNPDDLIPTLRSLKCPNANSKLVFRISNLIQDCVPAGTFKDGPSHRDIWKFIRNVMESYIQLKKNDNNLVVSKIQGCLGVGESADVYQEVLKIYNSLHFLELLFDKLKAKLGLPPHVTAEEVEQAIEEI